jgi:hypothetical protein
VYAAVSEKLAYVGVWLFVSPAGGFHGLSVAALLLPEAGLGDKFSDVGDGARNWIFFQDPRCGIWRRRDKQFEVLAVAERVVKCSSLQIGRFLLFG